MICGILCDWCGRQKCRLKIPQLIVSPIPGRALGRRSLLGRRRYALTAFENGVDFHTPTLRLLDIARANPEHDFPGWLDRLRLNARYEPDWRLVCAEASTELDPRLWSFYSAGARELLRLL
jgi:hypothetical protein